MKIVEGRGDRRAAIVVAIAPVVLEALLDLILDAFLGEPELDCDCNPKTFMAFWNRNNSKIQKHDHSPQHCPIGFPQELSCSR